ncbi:MAG: diaminopimelate epimerase [Deltaproteobacteria bacterium]|nr:diaminopimelate epimerase [Deltaproteobacteria bacterium]
MNISAGIPEDAFDYYKYHGLGNDYLVISPRVFGSSLPPAAVRAICDRHRGPGGDGILLGPLPAEEIGASAGDVPALRIYNPDGSEGEKSGNGLRIFIRHLWEQGLAPGRRFDIATRGGMVSAQVLDETGARIAVGMGRLSFQSAALPMTGPSREVLGEKLSVGGGEWSINCVSVGNPHCVVLLEPGQDPSESLARRIGPELENHPLFPNRTNVQFLRVLDEHSIRIEIWERGAGYTQASGTSSCAAAGVAVRLGLCSSPVTVNMPGGSLEIRFDDGFNTHMEGAVSPVNAGRFHDEFLSGISLRRRLGSPPA